MEKIKHTSGSEYKKKKIVKPGLAIIAIVKPKGEQLRSNLTIRSVCIFILILCFRKYEILRNTYSFGC